jgi:pimeloyl-ACP methyl ester carboxylesterase
MPDKTPVLFVHGLWVAAAAWQPWVELFAAAGYAPVAPLWPGESESIAETRDHPERQAGNGIAEVVAHFADVAASLPGKPIAIGHSFGGLIVQNLVTRGLASAAVAIDPAQIKGVLPLPPAQIKAAMPVLGNPANRKRALTLNPKQYRYAFGNAVSEQESNQLHEQWMIPSPGRPLFQAALANFVPNSPAKIDTRTNDRGPLLFIAGSKDHTAPPAVVRAAYKLYRHSSAVTDYQEIENRGHSLTIDSGWRGVADVAMNWLAKQGLAPAPA